jgi:hypothetical protein
MDLHFSNPKTSGLMGLLQTPRLSTSMGAMVSKKRRGGHFRDDAGVESDGYDIHLRILPSTSF